MKGVSPVVATVLLIAIAVIAAIGVWYWVGAYTGKPAVGVEQKAMSITSCNLTHVLVRNTGALKLDTAADIYSTAGNASGTILINNTNLDAGDVAYVALSLQVAPGVYNVIDSDYPEYAFTCA